MTTLEMSKVCRIILYIMTTLISVKSAFPPSLRYPLPLITNKIKEVATSCDAKSMNISLSLEYPFKGLLFAKDFSQECKSLGSLSNTVQIFLPTSSCGVRLSSQVNEDGTFMMFYTVSLVVQQDRHLRQITDQEKFIQCIIEDDAFVINSKSMSDVLKNDLSGDFTNHRKARMRIDGWSKNSKENEEEELNEALMAARAWMEIIPESGVERSSDTLQVGEPTLLTLKSTLPVGIGWRVVECVAHDGLGDSSQKLLDERGCPADELLLPLPQLGPVRPIALMRHQEAVAKFAAFKFPDRDRLHLSCGLQLCRRACSKIDCSNWNDTSENRLGRTLTKGQDGEILDRLEVFNSVEVLAPDIDDLRKNDNLQVSEQSTYPFSNLPGDRTFCVSPEKMAIAFCMLGLIFLIAVIVAALALFKARQQGVTTPYYTRSLFSSTTSGSAYGSKLLLQESPCMGQSPSRGLQYGRIL